MGQIAAGTSGVLKLLIYRMGMRALKDDLKMIPRAIDVELKVPMPTGKPLPKKPVSSEGDILGVLAENYRINPGLHMTMNDIKELLDVNDEDLNKYLVSLEEKGVASLYRDKRGTVSVARVTLKGLSQANPPDYYKYMPSWVGLEDMF